MLIQDGRVSHEKNRNLNIHVHLEYTDKNHEYEILYTNLSTL